ncbi:sensor histidine kinase [uncultured Fibrella sp.]|uniref:sensor histidine kinase n=1 Tax=uncultured Fibrella sp. TaxID=1284596 RepID=UPI0035CBC549
MRYFIGLVFSIFLITVADAQQDLPAQLTAYKRQLAQTRTDSIGVRLCVLIGQAYLVEHQYDSLYRYTQRGFALLKKAPSPYYAGDLYYFLARYYRAKSVYKKAILPMQQAVREAQRAQSPEKLARFQYSLAMIYSDANDLSKSIDQIAINLKQLTRHPNDNLLADNYLLVIELFKVLKNRPMRERYINRYLALVKPSWLPVDRMFAYFLKAEALTEAGSIKQAGIFYQRGFRQALLTNNRAYIAAMQCELGINWRTQKKYLAAIRAFTDAFSTARLITDKSIMAESRRELALTYLVMNQPARALAPARYALRMALINKQEEGILASQTCLVMALKANGKYQEALGLSEERQALNEKHFSDNTMQKIARMQTEFETEKKEQTIKILQKNAQINHLNTLRQQEQLTLNQRTQMAGIVVIGLLMIVIGLVVHGLRKSRRSYALLTRQQELLQQTASQLAETNAVKDKLFSLISHDLRSPLASMKNTLRQVREDDQQSQPLLPVVGRLEKHVDSILDLLTNILDWSLTQLKGFDSLLQPIRLDELTAEMLNQASELIAQKQLRIINQVTDDRVVLADKHQLRAVIRNLLGNAIKFTPVGGYIRLYTVVQADHVELRVRDSGVGMSVDQVERVFHTPDIRTGTGGERGVGLGLRLCRDLLNQQGGTLRIDCPAGGGTQASIRLGAFTRQDVAAQPAEAS